MLMDECHQDCQQFSRRVMEGFSGTQVEVSSLLVRPYQG